MREQWVAREEVVRVEAAGRVEEIAKAAVKTEAIRNRTLIFIEREDGTKS
jgi:hypothetical protein